MAAENSRMPLFSSPAAGRPRIAAVAAVTLALAATVAGQAPADARRIIGSEAFGIARRFIQSDHDRFVRELITLTEIPAPPFKEERRAKAYLALLKQHGLADVEMDAEGNAMGVRKGTGSGPLLAILAHLDTVFPEGTDVTVKRDGTRLRAPGIGDDT